MGSGEGSCRICGSTGSLSSRLQSFEWDEALIQPDDAISYGEQRFYAVGKVEGACMR